MIEYSNAYSVGRKKIASGLRCNLYVPETGFMLSNGGTASNISSAARSSAEFVELAGNWKKSADPACAELSPCCYT